LFRTRFGCFNRILRHRDKKVGVFVRFRAPLRGDEAEWGLHGQRNPVDTKSRADEPMLIDTERNSGTCSAGLCNRDDRQAARRSIAPQRLHDHNYFFISTFIDGRSRKLPAQTRCGREQRHKSARMIYIDADACPVKAEVSGTLSWRAHVRVSNGGF
jgi:hypothetical protein